MCSPLKITGFLTRRVHEKRVWGPESMVNRAYGGSMTQDRCLLPGPVNWVCLLCARVHRGEASRGGGFTRAAQTAGGYFKSGGLCGCLAGTGDTRKNPKTCTSSHLEKASSRPSSNSCQTEHRKRLKIKLEWKSQQCLFMQMFYLCVHINSLLFSNIKWSEPHTLYSYVTSW